MKIALPTNGNQVDSHFGHCEFFTLLTIDEDKNIIAEEKLAPPPGCGCKSQIVPQLAEKGVRVMLAGNMGAGAVNKLTSHGIRVIRGCSGSVRQVAGDWLAGKLTDSGMGCLSHGPGCSQG